jgi:hypothetical protein
MNTSQFCHCSVGMMNRSHCGNERGVCARARACDARARACVIQCDGVVWLRRRCGGRGGHALDPPL